MKKRMLSLFLAIVLCLSLLSTAALADGTDSGAAGTAAIQRGTAGLQSPTATETEGGTDYMPNSYVYFGTNGETPVKWRVLDAAETSDGKSGVLLLSEQLLTDNVPFDAYGESNAWTGSDAQSWCADFVAAAFSGAENDAIRETYKKETDKEARAFGTRFSASELDSETVFFLSAKEAERYLGSYDRAPQLSAADGNSNAAVWWLRSPYPGDQPGDVQVGIVNADGVVTADAVTASHAARPALNLDSSAVLFASPAQYSSNVGLEPVDTYTGSEWKLTLKDKAHSAFTAKTTGTNEAGLTFSYQNAQTGKNEYLSTIVTGADGGITHYGRVQSKAISESDSIQFIALPADFDEKTDKIYIFNERDNGDYKTNCASDLVELSLTPEDGEAFSVESITAVGNGRGNWLNGAAYANDTPSNRMTETSQNVYEITYTGIAASGKDDYAIRFVTTGDWTHSWGAAYDEENETLPGVAAYNGDNIYFTVDQDDSTVRLVLDLSGFDFDTKEGATYSITITPPGGGPEEPSAAEVTSGGQTTGYPTLAAAFAAAQDGDTVKLLEDVAEESAIAISAADVAFDLNGHTAPGCTLTLQSGADLTIKDSSAEKTGSFGDVTVNAHGSLILDGAAVGKITVVNYFASITLKAGTKFAGYENPEGMVLAEWIEDGCCVVSDDSGAVSLVDNKVKSQNGSFTVEKAPATITAATRSGSIRYSGLMPEDFIPEITAEDASTSVDMQWYCWSLLSSDQLAPITEVGTIDLKDPSNPKRVIVKSEDIIIRLGFDFNDKDTMRGVFCVLTAKDSGGNELWSTVLHGYTFTLKKADLSEAVVTATNAPVFTPDENGVGQTQTLEFKVTHISSWNVLYENFDYQIKGNSNRGENAGEYWLVLEGMGNYTGTLSYKWEVKPCELLGFNPIKKYDGTTDLKDDTAFYYLNPGLNYVLLSKKDGKDFTATGGFDDPNVGERNVDVTITLNNENYTFEDGEKTRQFTFEEVSIEPADSPEDPQPVTITVYNNRETVYTYDVSQLLPKLDGGRSYGTTTYSAWWNLDNTYVPEEPDNKPTIDSNGVLRLPINAVDSSTEKANVAFFKITVQSTNYYDFDLRIYVKACNPLTPTTVAPTLSKDTLTYGDKLSGITLSGAMTGENNETVEGTFAWVNPDETPNAGEAVSVTWKFTPTEPKYAEVTGTATITVNPAQLTGVQVDQQDDLTYNGSEQRASVETSATAVNDQKVTFTYCDTQDGTYSETVPAFTDAGEYRVYYKATAPNHKDAVGSFKVIINKEDPICTAPTGVSAVYGQTLSEITLTNPDSNTPGTWTWADGTQRVGDVGEHTFMAKFTPDDEINYNSRENISVSVTVVKAQPAASAAPAAKDLVYTGEAQTLIEPGTTADGTMVYSLSKDGDYVQTIPAGIGAGKYVVWYKIIGDDNHKDSEPAGVEAIIARQPVAIPEADTSRFTYNGADHTYMLAENAHYTIAGNKKKDAGVYTVTVTLKDTVNFVWNDDTDAAKEYTFTIAAAQLTVTVKDKRAYVYGTAPDLSKPVLNLDYTVSGLIGSDTLTAAPTLTYDPANPDLNKIGEAAAIRASGASAGRNYEITYVDGKLTVVARPSSGGTSYPITVKDSKNGRAASSHNSAGAGTTVTITVTPDKGYTLETLTVTDKDGNALKLTDQGNGRYVFTMPASGATVTATFMDDNTMLNFFVDVKTGDYFYDAVLWAAQEGITNGTDAVHFSPDWLCTRAQIVTFLWRAAGSPVVDYAMNMTDVPGDAYYAEAVRWALCEGITNGTTKTTFSPNESCTRAQAVTFLYRSQKAAAEGGMAVREFTDFDSIPAYAVDAVQWALENHVTNGVGNGSFAPNAACTRAQIVTFLYRLHLSKQDAGR